MGKNSFAHPEIHLFTVANSELFRKGVVLGNLLCLKQPFYFRAFCLSEVVFVLWNSILIIIIF